MRILAFVLFVLSIGAGRASPAELSPIDCSGSPFGFTGGSYNLDCEQSNHNTHVDETAGSVQTDVMTISSDDRQMFLTVVSQLIIAPRIYLEHRGLSESFHNIFEHADAQDWKTVGNKQGYDVAEFHADVSGQQSSC